MDTTITNARTERSPVDALLATNDARPVSDQKTRQRGTEGTRSVSSNPLSLRSLRVGDEVVVTSSNHTSGRRRVARIGRRYLYIQDAVAIRALYAEAWRRGVRL